MRRGRTTMMQARLRGGVTQLRVPPSAPPNSGGLPQPPTLICKLGTAHRRPPVSPIVPCRGRAPAASERSAFNPPASRKAH